MDTITITVVYLGLSLIFLIAVFFLLRKRNAKHAIDYPKHWELLKNALERDHTVDIANYGSNVIWNDHLQQEHKRIIYQEVENRKDRTELQQLWKDVHYKTHGFEPT